MSLPVFILVPSMFALSVTVGLAVGSLQGAQRLSGGRCARSASTCWGFRRRGLPPVPGLLMVVLSWPLGPTEAPLGANFGLTLRRLMPVSTERVSSSVGLILSPFMLPRGSRWSEWPPGACSVLLLLLLLMPRIRARVLPSVVHGGRIFHAGLLANRTSCSLLMPMPAWALWRRHRLAAGASASRRTLVAQCSTGPWWSLV